MSFRLLLICTALLVNWAQASQGIAPSQLAHPPAVLKVIVSESNPAPYAYFSVDGKLSGGISKLLIDEVGRRMAAQIDYLDVPRARIEPWVKQGKADIACFLNPDWVSEADKFNWTAPLFYSQQLIIRRQSSSEIRAIMDLYRKRVGTNHGFRYPELDDAFSSKQIIRDDAHSLISNLQRLAQGRLDAVMTVDLTYWDVMKSHQFQEKFAADPLWTAPSPVYCAVSPHSVHRLEILKQFNDLTSEGFVLKVIKPYQQPVPM